jgi:phospholipid/cholesterol/gamma-HCH transport system substrate-binding protein
VQVTMELSREAQDAVRSDSLAGLTSLGALADTVVDIDSEHATGPPVQNGDELKTLNKVLDLKAGQDTVRSLNETENRFNTVVDQMEHGKGTLGQFISNPGLTDQLSDTARKVQNTTTKLTSENNSAGKLLNGHDVGDKFADIGKNAQGLSASVTKLTNGPLQANINAATTHANSLITSINKEQGAAGMLIKNPKQITDTMVQANALIDNYTKNPATGGNFAAGGATALDLKKLQTETSALTTMIRQNPKKYFSIQFRVF